MVKIKGGRSSERSINISKGIIFAFFAIYLIVYGIGLESFIDGFNESNPGVIPVYVNYLPLACYVGAGFLSIYFLFFIRSLRVYKTRQLKSTQKVKASSVYKQALFLLIFIFAFVPLLSPIIDQGKNDQNFSAYNDEWNGSSKFKELLEGQGYEVGSVQSSLSTTERLDQPVLLILLGPNQFYNPVYEIPYFINFFRGNNSIMICHDHGSTSTLLWEIFVANALDPSNREDIPLTIFPDGVLRDNQSYVKNPTFPVITEFTNNIPAITQNVEKVLLSRSSCVLGGPFVEYSGWNVLGYSSLYSFVDKNDDKKYNFDDDSVDISFILDLIGSDFSDDFLKIPLGGYPQVSFMAKDTGNSRVFVSADASCFNNELIDEPGYDNAEFGINVVNWLTRGNKNMFIAFDEAHIRPEESRDLSSAGIFGFIMQYIVHLSTNPITAWIYPLMAVMSIRKYLPKKEAEEEKRREEEEKKEEKARFRTSSFFANKIEWYKEKGRYGKALVLLYRRLERKLNSLLGGETITTAKVVEMVRAKELKLTKQKGKRIENFMDTILSIKEGKGKIRSEEEFEDLFFEMEWIMVNI